MNTWPGGNRHAMSQDDHETWNQQHYPGTLQLCYNCDDPTTFCEEDGIFDDAGNAYCQDCAIGAGLVEGDIGN